MVSIGLEVSIREDDLAWVLKLFNMAFKDKEPTKEDEKKYNLFKVLHDDIQRENKEENADD